LSDETQLTKKVMDALGVNTHLRGFEFSVLEKPEILLIKGQVRTNYQKQMIIHEAIKILKDYKDTHLKLEVSVCSL
jgi:hypothetical protein